MKQDLTLSKVYTLLEPGPAVLLTTRGKAGPNVMTMSWHTMMEFEPPLVGCVISDRNYSFELVRATKECVINIPTVDLAETVVGCANTSGAKINKFEKFGLTAKMARQVKAPLIAECYANLECRVIDTRMVAKYGFFVLEVLRALVDPAVKNPRTIHHFGMGNFMVAGDRIKLPSRMK